LLPQLAELHKKYRDQGFQIVGLECQGSSASDIKALVSSKGVEYQITTGGDLRGSNVTGIPHLFVFGPDGKLAADNPHGAALEEKVKELLKETLGMMAGPGPYKRLARLQAQIKSGRGLGSVLKTLRTKRNSKNAEEAKEAKMMFEALNGAAQSKLEHAQSLKERDPVKAIAHFDKLGKMFMGDEVANTAKKEAQALKKDPKIRKEIQADGIWKKIEAMVGQLKPYRGAKDYSSSGFRKVNQASIRVIVGGCMTMTKRYAGTNAAKKAESLMNQFR